MTQPDPGSEPANRIDTVGRPSLRGRAATATSSDPRTRFLDLVSRRERLTPVERLRRRAVATDKPLVTGDHATDRDTGDDSAGRGRNQRTAFRLVCWNIEDGLDIDGAVDGLTSHPNLVAADAVCLQEMDPEGVDRIARTLDLNYLYLESSQDERTGRGFGNAILSPWPLTGHVTLPLPYVAKAYGRPRCAVGATVTRPPMGSDINPMAVAVWSVHTEIPSLSLTRRVAQYTAVAAGAITPNPDHLLLAGDFNTSTATAVESLDDLYALFNLSRLSEPAGPSLRRAGRLFHLDHIFGRGLTVQGVGVERTVIASDHWPLWVDVVGSARD